MFLSKFHIFSHSEKSWGDKEKRYIEQQRRTTNDERRTTTTNDERRTTLTIIIPRQDYQNPRANKNRLKQKKREGIKTQKGIMRFQVKAQKRQRFYKIRVVNKTGK